MGRASVIRSGLRVQHSAHMAFTALGGACFLALALGIALALFLAAGLVAVRTADAGGEEL